VKVLRSKRRILGIICRKFRQASSEHPAHQRPKSGGTAAGECTLAYQVKGWSGSMRYVLSLMLAVSALGIMPASSEETELGVSLASLDNAITVGSNGNDRPDDGRNMALEGEFESPEMIAVIERNREDRERTVVIDR
jgi:hypothetical protein